MQTQFVDGIANAEVLYPMVDGLVCLLVEDNPINRLVATKFLNKFGVEVDAAADGLEATKLAKTRGYDFILMDLVMPVMNGFDSTTLIRSEDGPNRETRIIAFTSLDNVCAKSHQMDEVLPKPFTLKELRGVLMRCAKLRRSNTKRFKQSNFIMPGFPFSPSCSNSRSPSSDGCSDGCSCHSSASPLLNSPRACSSGTFALQSESGGNLVTASCLPFWTDDTNTVIPGNPQRDHVDWPGIVDI